MPKEIKKRQRGGRSKKKSDPDQQTQAPVETRSQPNDSEFHEQDFVALDGGSGPLAGPSLSRAANDAPTQGGHEVDPAAPFGFVDPDVKAYFRSVDERLREWEGLGLGLGEDAESELEGAYYCQGVRYRPRPPYHTLRM